MLFSDRQQAATLLADKLQAYRGHMPLVLAIPRGAVPMARNQLRVSPASVDVEGHQRASAASEHADATLQT